MNEYILVSQDHMHVEQYIRQEIDRWLLVEYAVEKSLITLTTIGCEILLADIYEKVNLDE